MKKHLIAAIGLAVLAGAAAVVSRVVRRGKA